MSQPSNIQIDITHEMRSSYLDYSMSVIVGRALPNVRDGLKPVHRRILYAMYKEGILSNRRYVKCAGVVGEVIKRYHPHGDSAVYDALVRMAQEWNLRYPLVDGQGNFGSVDGDPPAAYRYTECRMTKAAESLLADIDKETVDFSPNFDGVTVEPDVLPTVIPNLLVNGSAGIAVGMATNIPPHNLSEVVAGTKALLDNPDISIKELMSHIPGPDFPTAGEIVGRAGIWSAYHEGRGRIIMRGRTNVEEWGRDRLRIVIDELPYQVNKARLLQLIGQLVNQGKMTGISGIRDESDRRGMRVVVELKKGAIAQVVLNQLYKHTPLQSTFGVIMLAIVDGRPRVLNLKEMLEQFLLHRREVVVRRTEYLLRKARARAHILEGLIIALDHIDEVIRVIRQSPNTPTARVELMKRFGLSEIQAQAILDMRLAKLTGLERDSIRAEYKQLLETIADLLDILEKPSRVRTIIGEELDQIVEQFGDERRTRVVEAEGELTIEDLIEEEDVVVTISHRGYVKRSSLDEYRLQRRGGRGRTGMSTRDDDFVEDVFVVNSHSYILIFTRQGMMFWLKVYRIPQGGPAARGRSLINLVPIDQGDKIAALVPVTEFDDDRSVVMVTRQGMVKRSMLSVYKHVKTIGIIGCGLNEGDELLTARLFENGKTVLMAASNGKVIRFIGDEEVRAMGRTARGVRGIKLAKGEEVVSLAVLDEARVRCVNIHRRGDEDTLYGGAAWEHLTEGTEYDVIRADKDDYIVLNDNGEEIAVPRRDGNFESLADILCVTENGYGKRTRVSEYRIQGRGGQGIIGIQATKRNGPLVGVRQVSGDEGLFLVTDKGKLIRVAVSEISQIGRNSQGVTIIRTESEERVVGLSLIRTSDEDDEGNAGDAADGAADTDGADAGADTAGAETDGAGDAVTAIAQRAGGTRAGEQGSSPADLGRASGTAGPAAADDPDGSGDTADGDGEA